MDNFTEQSFQFQTRGNKIENQQNVPTGKSVEFQSRIREDFDRLMFVNNFTLTTTPVTIHLPRHYGFSIQNFSGVATVQLSNKLTLTFQDFVEPSETVVLDNHLDREISLKLTAGTANVRIMTW